MNCTPESFHNQLKHPKTGIHTTATIDDVLYFLEDEMEKKLVLQDKIIEDGTRNIKDSHMMRTQVACHPQTEWTAAKDGSIVKMTWDVTKEGEAFKLTTHYRIVKDGEYKDSDTVHYLKPNRMSQCIGSRCMLGWDSTAS